MLRRRWVTIALAVTSFTVWMITAAAVSVNAQGSGAAPSANQAQVEKGRQAVGEICVACHQNIMRMVSIHRKTAEQWKDTVYSMIGRGALILPDEIEPLTAFLAVTAGPTSPRATSTTAGARAPQGAPASEGRAILERSCQMCHDAVTATTKPVGQEWSAVIDKMVGYGANLTAADRQKLLEHLNSLPASR